MQREAGEKRGAEVKYKNWTIYGDSYLAEWGEYEWAGSWTGERVLWQGRHEYSNENRVLLKMHIGGRRVESAHVTLHYYGVQFSLFSFKCRSLKEAARKANFRLRGQMPSLVKRAITQLYATRGSWQCCYRREQPFCSFYYPSYEITNGRGLPGTGEYTMVRADGSASRYQFHATGYCGSGMEADPAFPYWIPAPAAKDA